MEDYEIEGDDSLEDENRMTVKEILKIHGILSYAQTL